LRGLWGTYGLLDEDLRLQAQQLVDVQLERLGAEPETTRAERRRQEALSAFSEVS